MDVQTPVNGEDPLKDASTGHAAGDLLPLVSGTLRKPVIAAAAALVILPVLYRIGFVGSIVILVLAIALNAVPETRQLFDAFLGQAPTGRSRLALVESLEGRDDGDRDELHQSGHGLLDDTFIDLQVGGSLQAPVQKLVDLVQRDFISYWYDSSVALSSNTPFPKYTRSTLNCIVNNLVTRMKRQDPKEVSIYLFHSLSNAVITQLRQEDDGISVEQSRSDKDILVRKIRRTSEELMLTLAPRSNTSSPMVLSLLTEVISLQIWSTIQSLNSDYINAAIVDNFGEAISLAKEAQQNARASDEPKSQVEAIPIAAPYAGPPPVMISKNPTDEQHSDAADYSISNGVPKSNTQVTSAPAHSIKLDDPNHTVAAAGMPGYTPTLDFPMPRLSSESARKTSIASPTSSQPGSPRSLQKKRLEDQTLEEALEHGAARFRAFGKNLVTAGQKFLDAALPVDEDIGTPGSPSSTSGARLKSLSSAGPSRKGKEREIEPVDPVRSPLSPTASIHNGSPTSSLRGMSVDAGTSRASSSSAVYTGSSSRPPSMVGKSSLMSRSSSAHSSLFASVGPPAQQPLSPAARIQRILDSLETASPEQREKLVKQIEISLFSKDLSLLFPDHPPDEQLRAVLMRHTASDETVDPTLIELSDAFHDYLEKDGDDGKTGDLVLRMWTLLDHFGYMVDITHPDEGQIQGDGLQLLKKIIVQAKDLEIAFQRDSHETENTEALEQPYWTAVELAILRLQQNPNREIFDPLKDWLLRFIQVSYWDRFLRTNPELAGASGVTASSAPSSRLARVPSASTSKRTLSFIAATSARPNQMQEDSFDLGESMRSEEPEAVVQHVEQNHHRVSASSAMSRKGSQHAQSSAMSKNGSQHAPSPAIGDKQSFSAIIAPEADANSTTPTLPSFSVSITDLSPPSAYQNNHVKSRKDLEFLIAVEVEGSPGYILARKYLEFEKMDHGIKKALPQSGTKGFPRAPLPSTNFQTSDNLCRSLENYLEALLREPRYASCDPVARFFEKERTDSKTGVVNPLLFLGQGVNNIGKGVTEVGKGIGRSGEMATRSIATGFNQFTNTITGMPGLKRTNSGLAESSGPPTPVNPGDTTDKRPAIDRRTSADSQVAPTTQDSRQSLMSPSNTSLVTSMTSVKEEEEGQQQNEASTTANLTTEEAPTAQVPAGDGKGEAIMPSLPPRPASPDGYEVPEVSAHATTTREESIVESTGTSATLQNTDAGNDTPPGFSYTPRKKTTLASAPDQSDDVLEKATLTPEDAYPAAPVDAGGRMSFDELLEKDRELQKMMAKKEAEREQLNADLLPELSASADSEQAINGQAKRAAGSASPAQRSVSQSNLSAVEFSSILSFAMAILEEAYELSDSTWNLRRGILRMLETVLRTSYAGVIRAGMTKLVQSVSEEDFYVQQINKLRESFWPSPDNVWWSSVEGYQPAKEKTAQEKEATRREARKLLQMQAPEGLKVALGPTATTVALGRLHDCLQGPGAEAIVSSMMLDYLRLLLL